MKASSYLLQSTLVCLMCLAGQDAATCLLVSHTPSLWCVKIKCGQDWEISLILRDSTLLMHAWSMSTTILSRHPAPFSVAGVSVPGRRSRALLVRSGPPFLGWFHDVIEVAPEAVGGLRARRGACAARRDGTRGGIVSSVGLPAQEGLRQGAQGPGELELLCMAVSRLHYVIQSFAGCWFGLV